MKASTELLLWQILSLAECLFRPSYCHIGEGFEGWASRKGLLRQVQRLEAEAFLERQRGGTGDRVYRLTSKGRLAALGGKDPEERWRRSWDGRWRLLMFDLPEAPAGPRKHLRKVLRAHGLGCLQGSVWLSPDPLDPLRRELRGDRHPSSLLLFEGDAIGGEKSQELVKDAWDFGEIEQRWLQYARVLEQGKRFVAGNGIESEGFQEWVVNDHQSWKSVIEIDPLLPATLLPGGYPGRRIWKRRQELAKKMAVRLRNTGFSPHDATRQ